MGTYLDAEGLNKDFETCSKYPGKDKLRDNDKDFHS